MKAAEATIKWLQQTSESDGIKDTSPYSKAFAGAATLVKTAYGTRILEQNPGVPKGISPEQLGYIINLATDLLSETYQGYPGGGLGSKRICKAAGENIKEALNFLQQNVRG